MVDPFSRRHIQAYVRYTVASTANVQLARFLTAVGCRNYEALSLSECIRGGSRIVEEGGGKQKKIVCVSAGEIFWSCPIIVKLYHRNCYIRTCPQVIYHSPFHLGSALIRHSLSLFMKIAVGLQPPNPPPPPPGSTLGVLSKTTSCNYACNYSSCNYACNYSSCNYSLCNCTL